MVPVLKTARQQLLDSLRGRTLLIPDLEAPLRHWPQDVSPDLERLSKDVGSRLEMLFPAGNRLRKMKAADTAFFGAAWWPFASFEALRIATYLGIWLFAWDDGAISSDLQHHLQILIQFLESDSEEFSSLVCDPDGGRAFRMETIAYIRQSLAVDSSGPSTSTTVNPIITSFKPIGDAIRCSSTAAQREMFLNELIFFVEMTDAEQCKQMSGEIPTAEEYIHRRMGTGAVAVCLAITEYCFGMEIPPLIMHSEDMRALWVDTNVIICVANDILSIKKEIAQGQVDSIVPLLYFREGSIDAAVKGAHDIYLAAVHAFETHAERLTAQHSRDGAVHDNVQRMIYACRCACTANITWSLRSGRYGLGTKSLRNGLKIKL